MHQLWFSHAHSYSGQDAAITLPVVLRSGNRLVDLIASLDTGASSCLFESGYAAELGLDLESGVMAAFRTANSNFNAYGHEVQIEVLGITVHSLVYFFADQAIRKNVLGRRGWLDRLRLAIVDYDRALYLGGYG
jgi:predicted aspartyl protease